MKKASIYTQACQVSTTHVIILPKTVDTWQGCAIYLQNHTEYPLFSKNAIGVYTWCNYADTVEP